jgi:hypothetical protein
MFLTGPFGFGANLIGFIGSILLIIGLALIVAIGVTLLVRILRHDGTPDFSSFGLDHTGLAAWWRRITGEPDPALAELRLRYARGEVTQEEYLIRAYDLGGSPVYSPPSTPGHVYPAGKSTPWTSLSNPPAPGR